MSRSTETIDPDRTAPWLTRSGRHFDGFQVFPSLKYQDNLSADSLENPTFPCRKRMKSTAYGDESLETRFFPTALIGNAYRSALAAPADLMPHHSAKSAFAHVFVALAKPARIR
jgi:hypothetical protein